MSKPTWQEKPWLAAFNKLLEVYRKTLKPEFAVKSLFENAGSYEDCCDILDLLEESCVKGKLMYNITIPGMGGGGGVFTSTFNGIKGMFFPVNGEDFFVDYVWGDSTGIFCMPTICRAWESFNIFPIVEPDDVTDDFALYVISKILGEIGFDVETEVRFNKILGEQV